MDILYQSCPGIDVYQYNTVVCVLHSSLTSTHPKREESHFDATTSVLKSCFLYCQVDLN